MNNSTCLLFSVFYLQHGKASPVKRQIDYDSKFPLRFMDMNWYTPEPATNESSAEVAVSPASDDMYTLRTTRIVQSTTLPPSKESESSAVDISSPFSSIKTLENSGSSDITLNEGCGCASGCACNN